MDVERGQTDSETDRHNKEGQRQTQQRGTETDITKRDRNRDRLTHNKEGQK